MFCHTHIAVAHFTHITHIAHAKRKLAIRKFDTRSEHSRDFGCFFSSAWGDAHFYAPSLIENRDSAVWRNFVAQNWMCDGVVPFIHIRAQMKLDCEAHFATERNQMNSGGSNWDAQFRIHKTKEKQKKISTRLPVFITQ